MFIIMDFTGISSSEDGIRKNNQGHNPQISVAQRTVIWVLTSDKDFS